MLLRGVAVELAQGDDHQFVTEDADDNAGHAGQQVRDETDGGAKPGIGGVFGEVDACQHAQRDAGGASRAMRMSVPSSALAMPPGAPSIPGGIGSLVKNDRLMCVKPRDSR